MHNDLGEQQTMIIYCMITFLILFFTIDFLVGKVKKAMKKGSRHDQK